MRTQLHTETKTQENRASTRASSGLIQRKCACGGTPSPSGECEDCNKEKRFGLQTKSKINEPGDIYEQEADRIADQVMAASSSAAVNGAPAPIQRFSGYSDAQLDGAPTTVDQALASPGRLLEPTLRQDMEHRFGYDFSHVRVHSGAAADQSARDMNATAFTVGQNIVFGAGRFAPSMYEGRWLMAHELTHVVQQSGADGNRVDQSNLIKLGLSRSYSIIPPANPQLIGAGSALQRQKAEAPIFNPPPSPEEVTMHAEYTGPAAPAYGLRNTIQALVEKKLKTYSPYRETILKATPAEKLFALHSQDLLSTLRNTLDFLAFARCVEGLGRKAPRSDELRKNKVVAEAIKDAWKASDPGTKGDLVTQPHEEGGWVFMNLIDGSLSTERAPAVGKNFIDLTNPPDVENSVVVATFHTHPNMGPNWQAAADPKDKANSETRGLPSLIAGNPGNNPDIFQVFLAGPPVRKHLASDTKLPGRSGGIAP
jgi:Domain of unknown function (DUF4157)